MALLVLQIKVVKSCAPSVLRNLNLQTISIKCLPGVTPFAYALIFAEVQGNKLPAPLPLINKQQLAVLKRGN